MIKVVYSNDMFCDDVMFSPSARKPKLLAERLIEKGYNIRWINPIELEISDFYLCHDPTHVNAIMNCKKENGFDTISQCVTKMLLFTSGAMYKACLESSKDSPVAALVSGFHHAEYDVAQMFCTFNGLIVSALKLIKSEKCKKIAILDCDYHFGNGTEQILQKMSLFDNIFHFSFGKYYKRRDQANDYLLKIDELFHPLLQFSPDLIIYQAGADVHINDPLGGLFDDSQIYERDIKIFSMAKNLGVPIAWNLAGGYQVNKVIDIHENTFRACESVYS